MNGKLKRRRVIRALLEQQRIESQEQLLRLLEQEGVVSTQATLSRDLRDLGVLKGPKGYSLPTGDTEPPKPTPDELRQALNTFLLSGRLAQHLVVLQTGQGQANALANELDAAQLEGVVGTVAGDDTIFVATPSPRAARRLLNRLTTLAGS